MELKSIDNLLKPTTKASASLQTKVLMKKILFEKEISKIKEIKEKSKFFEKENFLNDNVEISNISLSLPKQFEKSGQKPLKKKEEIDECLYVDFREEIEKRFRKSVINKIYIFPRINEDEILFESFNSESSNESLKNIETYNLQSQKPKTNIKKTKQPDQEKERKNLSFQDFLTKIQEEKNKWTTQNSNASSYKKKSLVPSEETLKKPTKPNLKNSESVIQINRSSIEKNEENNCHNFSLLNKKASAEAEREKMNIKVIKGRNVIDLIPKPQKTKLNMSGSNSKRKENISANIFSTINSFHNKLLPKDKRPKKENSFQDFLQKKCNKKDISDLLFKNSAINQALKTDNNLINNPLYSKAKKQLLMEKEYKNLYRSVEGLNSLGLNTVKEKISPENYKSTQSPKKKNMLGAFSDENRCRKELMGIKKKENNNMQKSYDISKNTFKEFLMEHSRDQDPNKTDRMIVLQNYLKENKDNKTMKKK